MLTVRLLAIGAAASLPPGLAQARPKLAPAVVFQDAALPMQAIMLLLLIASLAAIANIGEQPPYPVMAPGFAEAAFIFVLGLIAGVVAVICNWVVEARIDRAVLRS